jgi:HEAT repeat protein
MAQMDRVDARESIELLLVTDPHPFVQRKAADALGQIGTLDSLPILERCLKQERPAARLAFRHGIDAIKKRYGVP